MISSVSSISSMLDGVKSTASTQSGAVAQGLAGVGFGGVGGAGLGAGSAAPDVSFGDIMSQVAGSAVKTLRAGEAASIAGIQGKAPIQKVVEAVMSAEQTLQTAIAIRDKVVGAYQEISRMTI